MARARTGGGAAAALVVFIIAFCFALIAAIIFASQKSRAVSDAEAARTERRQLLQENQQLTEQVQQLKNLVSSQPDLSVEALEQMRGDRGIEQALFDEVQRLSNELTTARSRADQAQAAADQAADQAAAAQQSVSQLQQSYNDTLDELRGQIDQIAGSFEAYRTGIAGSDQQLTQQMTQLRQQKDQAINDLQQQLRTTQSDLSRLRRELEEATRSGESLGMENVVPADGQVTAVAPANDVVYIDLGEHDHVLLGMTFEVFESNEIVHTDEYDRLRGKATVEVIEVDESTARARIVRSGYRSIIRPGDQIINLVYDPTTTYQFHVYGDFDLNGDGDATEEELRRVQSMVRNWGGELSDELSYEVDYLVLGREPKIPGQLPPDVIDPVVIAQNVEAQRNYERYQMLLGEARSLRIPILNQNRFLALVGFYER